MNWSNSRLNLKKITLQPSSSLSRFMVTLAAEATTQFPTICSSRGNFPYFLKPSTKRMMTLSSLRSFLIRHSHLFLTTKDLLRPYRWIWYRPRSKPCQEAWIQTQAPGALELPWAAAISSTQALSSDRARCCTLSRLWTTRTSWPTTLTCKSTDVAPRTSSLPVASSNLASNCTLDSPAQWRTTTKSWPKTASTIEYRRTYTPHCSSQADQNQSQMLLISPRDSKNPL